MPKTVQLRDIDDVVYAALRRHAAAAGMSVPELLRREAARLAARPTVEEWLARTRRGSGSGSSADNLPPRGRWVLQLLGSGLGLLFLVIVTWKGAIMSLRLWSAVSPVMELPQGSVYAVIPGTGLYMSAHLVARMYALLREGPRAVESP